MKGGSIKGCVKTIPGDFQERPTMPVARVTLRMVVSKED